MRRPSRAQLALEAGRLQGMAMMVRLDHYDPLKLATELHDMAQRISPEAKADADAARTAPDWQKLMDGPIPRPGEVPGEVPNLSPRRPEPDELGPRPRGG